MNQIDVNTNALGFESSNEFINDEESALLQNKSKSRSLTDYPLYASLDSIASRKETGINHSIQSRHSIYKSTRSVTSHSSLLITLLENVSADRKSTLFMTICNMLPILQGSSVFSVPYAIMVGGLSFIPACIVICLLADISGFILIDCLYTVSPRSKMRKRVYGSYGEITFVCWGKIGSKVVNCLTVVYIIANNVVNVVLLGKCGTDIVGHYLKGVNEPMLMLILSLFLIPPLFIKKLSILSYVSFIGAASIVIGCLTSFVVLVQHYSYWSDNIHQIPVFSLEGYPLAIGIIMYSVILNSILPQIEGSMKKPSQIKPAIHISFTVSTILKLLFGSFGVLTFGLSTKQIVALNLSEYSIYVKYIISISLCLYAFANYALMFFVVFDEFDEMLRRRNAYNYIFVILSRVGLTLLCVGIAVVIPYFALVSGIVGAIVGSCLVFIFPILFHLQLKWNETSKFKKCLEVMLLVFGVVVGGTASYSSIAALVNAIQKGE